MKKLLEQFAFTFYIIIITSISYFAYGQSTASLGFHANVNGGFNPDNNTKYNVKTVGQVSRTTHQMLKAPEPNWSRIILRNRNARYGNTDSIFEVKMADKFRLGIEGGKTSFEKVEGQATYIFDLTNSNLKYVKLEARPATSQEISNAAVAVGTIGIVTVLAYLLFL